MKTKQQARFWHWHNGAPVLIKVNAGQTLHHYQGGRTEEGSAHSAHVWEFDGETVTEQSESWGRDCDGGYGNSAAYHCALANLQTGNADRDYGVKYPKWESGEASQYDEHAEAAGY